MPWTIHYKEHEDDEEWEELPPQEDIPGVLVMMKGHALFMPDTTLYVVRTPGNKDGIRLPTTFRRDQMFDSL